MVPIQHERRRSASRLVSRSQPAMLFRLRFRGGGAGKKWRSGYARLLPDYGAAMCSHDSDYLYLFGGFNDFNFSSDLRRLRLSTMVWEKMEPTSPVLPTPVYRTSLVPYKDRLVVFGGVSMQVSDDKLREAGAEYTTCQEVLHDYGHNNEYHEFLFNEDHSGVCVCVWCVCAGGCMSVISTLVMFNQ